MGSLWTPDGERPGRTCAAAAGVPPGGSGDAPDPGRGRARRRGAGAAGRRHARGARAHRRSRWCSRTTATACSSSPPSTSRSTPHAPPGSRRHRRARRPGRRAHGRLGDAEPLRRRASASCGSPMCRSTRPSAPVRSPRRRPARTAGPATAPVGRPETNRRSDADTEGPHPAAGQPADLGRSQLPSRRRLDARGHLRDVSRPSTGRGSGASSGSRSVWSGLVPTSRSPASSSPSTSSNGRRGRLRSPSRLTANRLLSWLTYPVAGRVERPDVDEGRAADPLHGSQSHRDGNLDLDVHRGPRLLAARPLHRGRATGGRRSSP